MYTLGATTAKAIISRKNDYLVNVTGFCAAAIKEGETVKLNSDGTISAVTAVTDIPFGTVVVGNNGDVNARVTVMTNFKAIVRGQANGGITCGVRVSALASVVSGTETLTDYKTSVATNTVIGQALNTALDNAMVVVGLYYTPYTYTVDTDT